jgi:predicted permease
MLNRVRLWIRSVVLRRRIEREMQEEMAQHLERATERLMARGLSPSEAAREARREFGNVTYLQEEGRLARGTGALDALVADARFALRQFARRPGTTLTMLGVLAVGLCLSTIMFSFVQGFAVQPPPGIARADDLVRIRGSQEWRAARVARGFSEDEFLEYRKLTGPFAAVAGWSAAMAALDAGDEVERRALDARVTFVTDDYFPVLGVRPTLGPGLRPSADPAAALVAVIGHAAWNQLFEGDPAVIGRTVAVNGVPVTVVGVAPEGFTGVDGSGAWQLWMPLAAREAVMRGVPAPFLAAARLRPGVTAEEASGAVRVVAARAAAAEAARGPAAPEQLPVRPSAEVVPLLAENESPAFEGEVWSMSAGVGLLAMLVLLVTCTNVSALLTGLAVARRQEIAVRLSLGAGRGRILRQLLTENAVLACVAGAAALGLAELAVWAAGRLFPDLPMKLEITPQAVAFTFGVALAAGLAFGLSPALHATRLALAGVLRDSSSHIAAARGRPQRALVVAQIAFTMPLVVLLIALLLSLRALYAQGGATALDDRLATLSVRTHIPWSGPPAAAAEEERRLRAAVQRVAERVRDTPGVEAAVIEWEPMPDMGAYSVDPAGRGGGAAPGRAELWGKRVEAGYFATTGIPVVRGRAFQPDERTAGPGTPESAALIDADLARTLWPGADPVGRRLRAEPGAAGASTLVIVGVVDDPGLVAAKPGAPRRIFLPPDTAGLPNAVLVRTAGRAESLAAALRRVAQKEAPGMVIGVQTLAGAREAQRREMAPMAGGLLGAGAMALLLSAIGLYAVVAFSVSQRTGEIAVRIAVGAHARQIARRFVADGVRLSALGLALGLPVSLLGLRSLIASDDAFSVVALPAVTAIAALGVALVAIAAAWLPARRAASVDPAVVLRGV